MKDNRATRQQQTVDKVYLANPRIDIGVADLSKLPSYEFLRGVMARNFSKPTGMSEEELKKAIDDLRSLGSEVEGYAESETDVQRNLSVTFTWGHRHVFSNFTMKGAMQDRHLRVTAAFIDRFGFPTDLSGEFVLDVGAWTGGFSLLALGMGAAEVTAVEEVAKYVAAMNVLKGAFRLKNFEPIQTSLYEIEPDRREYGISGLITTGWDDYFDIAICSGVLYHVSDPALFLRILFNCLRDDGEIYIETAATADAREVLFYMGPFTSGWNWFFPSPKALAHILWDVGFEDIYMSNVHNGRLFAKATRKRHKPIVRAGLSNRYVR